MAHAHITAPVLEVGYLEFWPHFLLIIQVFSIGLIQIWIFSNQKINWHRKEHCEMQRCVLKFIFQTFSWSWNQPECLEIICKRVYFQSILTIKCLFDCFWPIQTLQFWSHIEINQKYEEYPEYNCFALWKTVGPF